MHNYVMMKDPFNIGFVLVGAMLFGCAVYFEAFEHFYNFSRLHEDWEIDEILTGFAMLAAFLPIFLVRWNRRLILANRAITLAKDRADHVALHDPLTGLHNRRYLQILTENGAKQGCEDPQNTAMSVLLIDLDRFKPINDLRGHDAGDDLLRQVAKRLVEVCSDHYQVIRLGGDEFAVLTTAAASEQSNSRLARRLQTAISAPFYIDAWTATISCSIGIATWAEGMSASDLLRNADQAMYRAKALGRGTYVHFDDDFGAEVRDQAGLEADFRLAVEQGHITPYFQPIHDIETGALSGFEVLSRWHHPTRGFVPPDRFIPLAEDLGLIGKLSDMVLSEACGDLASWNTDLGLSFNLSPSQFGDLTLPARIYGILQSHGLEGSRLEIEITERAVVADFDKALVIITELCAFGIRISMDDFGTGTSSLATLARLPFSKIKIDRSFIADIQNMPLNAKIVSGVLALAASLSLDVTAEGIETAEELEFLKSHSCTLGQGYLFSRPVPAAEISFILQAANAPGAMRRLA
jgi:diguanylate cyclase (GGDEF)-like protein